MEGIREYLIGVIVAALICGMVTALTDSKGTVAMSLKLVSGLMMLLAVVRPWVTLSLDGLFGWTDGIMADGTSYTTSGQIMAQEAYRTGIKTQTEAYIVDEARALGCDLSVKVTLSNDDLPVPAQVTLTGSISPYARQVLSQMMAERLGIEREDQIWT